MSSSGKNIQDSVSRLIPESFFARAEFLMIAVSPELKPLQTVAEICGIALVHLEKHIGRYATFNQKSRLHDYLSQLTKILQGTSVSDADKEAIKAKIAEGVEACTPGFMNRVNDCLANLTQATTVPQLIAMYRRELVERAAYALSANESQSVHSRQRFFQVANHMGLNIPLVAPDDAYAGSDLLGSTRETLHRVFLEQFTPSRIVGQLFRTSFARLGYVGPREEGEDYSRPGFNKVIFEILGFLKNALKNTDAYEQVDKQDCQRFLQCIIEEGDYDDDDFSDINAILDINWQAVISATTERLFLSKDEQGQTVLPEAHFAEVVELIPGKLILKINRKNIRDTLFIASKEPAKPLYFFAGNAEHFADCFSEESIKALKASKVLSVQEKDELIDSLISGGIDLLFDNLVERLKRRIDSRIGPHGLDKQMNLRDLLRELHEQQCKTFLFALGKGLNVIISDIFKLINLLNQLSWTKCQVVLAALGDQLRVIMLNAAQLTPVQLSTVLRYFDETQCQAVLTALGDEKLHQIIHNLTQLTDVLLPLNRPQCQAVLTALGDQLRVIMLNAAQLTPVQLSTVLRYLNETQCQAVLTALGDEKLHKIIHNLTQLTDVLLPLNRPQCQAVLTALGDEQLHKIIHNLTQLMDVLLRLNQPQCQAVLTALGDQLRVIMLNAAELTRVQLSTVLRYLDERQCQAVLTALGHEKLHKIIDRTLTMHYSSGLEVTLKLLYNDTQRIIFVNAIMINLDWVICVLTSLRGKEYITVINGLGEQLKALIATQNDLIRVLLVFTEVPCQFILDILSEKLLEAVASNPVVLDDVFERIGLNTKLKEPLLASFNQETFIEILTHAKNHPHALRIAFKYQVAAVDRILAAVGRLPEEEKTSLVTNMLTAIGTDGRNVLILAAKCKPDAVYQILETAKSLPETAKTSVLKKILMATDSCGLNALIEAALSAALSKDSVAVHSILAAVDRLPEAEQTAVLKAIFTNKLIGYLKNNQVGIDFILSGYTVRLIAKSGPFLLRLLFALSSSRDRQLVFSLHEFIKWDRIPSAEQLQVVKNWFSAVDTSEEEKASLLRRKPKQVARLVLDEATSKINLKNKIRWHHNRARAYAANPQVHYN